MMAKRHTTIHAAGSLLIKAFLREAVYELFIIVQPLCHRFFGWQFPGKFYKSCWLTHVRIFFGNVCTLFRVPVSVNYLVMVFKVPALMFSARL
jgi:hypothetical protein